jgi:hypothetical protein
MSKPNKKAILRCPKTPRSDGILMMAIRKCEYSIPLEEWYGQLTAVEILRLIEAGAEPYECSKRLAEEASDMVKNGEGGNRPFYFKPPKKWIDFI